MKKDRIKDPDLQKKAMHSLSSQSLFCYYNFLTKDFKKKHGLGFLAGGLGTTDVQAMFIYVSPSVSCVTAFEGTLEYYISQHR